VPSLPSCMQPAAGMSPEALYPLHSFIPIYF